jgi:hypothetical protein
MENGNRLRSYNNCDRLRAALPLQTLQHNFSSQKRRNEKMEWAEKKTRNEIHKKLEEKEKNKKQKKLKKAIRKQNPASASEDWVMTGLERPIYHLCLSQCFAVDVDSGVGFFRSVTNVQEVQITNIRSKANWN